MSKRFIIEKGKIDINNDDIKIYGEEVHHINVLRYKTGDQIYINENLVKISTLSKDKLEGEIVGVLEKRGEPTVNITLIQSYLKSDKMDYVVQKAVELGVKEVIPVISKNTVVKLDEKDKIKKQERLSKIAKEAIQQCGRTDSINIGVITDLNKIDTSKCNFIIICHEKSSNSLKEILNKIKEDRHKTKEFNMTVIIGPEGGFEDMEVENLLTNNNVFEVSLGERILRAETAGFCILSILGYEMN